MLQAPQHNPAVLAPPSPGNLPSAADAVVQALQQLVGSNSSMPAAPAAAAAWAGSQFSMHLPAGLFDSTAVPASTSEELPVELLERLQLQAALATQQQQQAPTNQDTLSALLSSGLLGTFAAALAAQQNQQAGLCLGQSGGFGPAGDVMGRNMDSVGYARHAGAGRVRAATPTTNATTTAAAWDHAGCATSSPSSSCQYRSSSNLQQQEAAAGMYAAGCAPADRSMSRRGEPSACRSAGPASQGPDPGFHGLCGERQCVEQPLRVSPGCQVPAR